MKLYIIVLLCFVSLHVYALQVIMLMGPSCAGKSTLAKHLCIQLNVKNEKWQTVDFDEVEENIELLIAATNNCLQRNSNVIVDTNTYEYEMEKKINGAVTINKIIVTAPLEVLLQRDERRTEYLKRDANRAYRCRHFVINSFNESCTWPCDFMIDTSQQSVAESCDIILKFLNE